MLEVKGVISPLTGVKISLKHDVRDMDSIISEGISCSENLVEDIVSRITERNELLELCEPCLALIKRQICLNCVFERADEVNLMWDVYIKIA